MAGFGEMVISSNNFKNCISVTFLSETEFLNLKLIYSTINMYKSLKEMLIQLYGQF